MRHRTLLLALAVLATTLWPAATASAGDDHGDEAPTVSTIPPGSVDIGDGTAMLGGVVTTEGQPPEEWDALRAAIFVQSFIGETFFGEPVLEDPPADLTVHRVDLDGSWGFDPGWITLYYVSDGETAWISLPEQPKRPSQEGEVPAPAEWFIANERAVGAFEGTEELIESTGTESATSTTTAPGGEQAGAAGDDDSDPPWIWLAVGGVAIAAVVALVLTRRGRPE